MSNKKGAKNNYFLIYKMVLSSYRKVYRMLRIFLPLSIRKKLKIDKLWVKLNLFIMFKLRSTMKFYFKNKNDLEVLLHPDYLRGLLECFLMTKAAKSDIIELGSYRGGSTTVCAHFLKKIKSSKIIYACDTFEGHPFEDKFSKYENIIGEFSDTNIPYVLKKFEKYDVLDKIKIIKGSFEDTLESKLGEKKFSLAFVDCDLYDSTKYVLSFLYPRMEVNGIICFHDYYPQGYKYSHWGITKAVDEFLQEKHLKIQLNPIAYILTNK